LSTLYKAWFWCILKRLILNFYSQYYFSYFLNQIDLFKMFCVFCIPYFIQYLFFFIYFRFCFYWRCWYSASRISVNKIAIWTFLVLRWVGVWCVFVSSIESVVNTFWKSKARSFLQTTLLLLLLFLLLAYL